MGKKLFYFSVLCFVTAILCFPQSSVAQDWYVGDARIPISNITPEQASRKAFEQARTRAIETAQLELVSISSRRISELSTGAYYDAFARYTQLVTHGLIVEEDTLKDGVEQIPSIGEGGSNLVYHVILRVYVVTPNEKPDPSFVLEINLNSTTFRDGDTMVIQLRASQDCYVTLFNLYSNDSLRVVVPSRVFPDNHISKDNVLTIPSVDSPYQIQVSLLPGVEQDIESIMAVAMKKDVPFTLIKSEGPTSLISVKSALLSINRWLAEVPASERSTSLEQYRVFDKR